MIFKNKREFQAYYRPLKQIAGGGGSKSSGEGSGGTPEEDADSLLSKQIAHIIDVWSEGQIEGWAHSEFPLLDIYFDGTPVQNNDAWGILTTGNTTNGSPIFTTTGGAPFQVFTNKHGVIKPHKSPMIGRWISEAGYTHLSFGSRIVSVEGEHSCTLDRPAIATGTGISWKLGGSVNYKDFSYQYRTGTQSQPAMQGFPAVEATFGVGTPLLQVGPNFSHLFNDATLDACRVDIEFRQMEETDLENGDIHGSEVRLKFFLNGSVVIDDTVTGKCSSAYIRTYKINFFGFTPPWTVIAQRMTRDSTTQAVRNPTFVSSYTEITNDKLRYPNTAMIGLRVNAKQFSAIPSRAYHLKGLKVKIPNNYNPITRNYTGSWSGTFSAPTWTDNPAWCWYDMATNSRYGLGHMLIEANIDKFQLYTIARYCDAVDGSGNYVGVPSGKGAGREPRFACNLFLQRHEDAIKVLQDMAGIFRGMLAYINGTITPIQDAPTDPTTYRMFSPANVINGTFVYSGVGLRARHNVAVVTWSDLTDVGKIKQEYVEDHDAITKVGGINQLDLTGFGCTSRGQARRIGLWAIYAEKILTDTISFSTALEGYFVTPGKIIRIQDPFRAGDVLSGRIKTGSTTNHLYLDRSVVITSGKVYFVGIISQTDGTLVIRQVTQANGTWSDITCNAFPFTPESDSIFQLGKYEGDGVTPTLVPELGRVLACTMKDENTVEITALKYNDSLYDFVDFDHPLDEDPISQLPPAGYCLPPTNFQSAVIQIIKPDHTIRQDVEVAWNASPDQYLAHYRPTYRYNNGNWVGRHGSLDTDNNEFRIHNAQPGHYDFQIYAVNTIGAISIPLNGDEDVETPPTNIGGVAGLMLFGGNHYNNQNRAVFQVRDAHFVWHVSSGTGPSVPFGDGPLEIGVPTSLASGFKIEIYNDDDMIWDDETTSSEYIYTWEKNVQATEDYYGANYGPLRIFRIEVRVKFVDNTYSNPARLTVENPLPPVPLDVTTTTGNGYIAWQWTVPNAPDIEKFGLFASLNPQDDDPPQVAEWHGTSGIYYPPIGTWHYWLGTIDSFGNVSANVPQGPPPTSYVHPPVFHPPAGSYELDPGQNYLSVTITEATQDCYIMYALVPLNTNPTTFTLYTGTPLHVTGQKTLYAVAYKIHPPLDSNSAQGNYLVDGYIPPPPPPQQTPPPNDLFANRIAISGAVSTTAKTGTLNGGTNSLEIGEPTFAESNKRTVWWTWTGITTGKFQAFWVNNDKIIIEAFTGGALGFLVQVGQSSLYLTGQLMIFTQTAGTPYQIRFRSNAGTSPDFAFVYSTLTCSSPTFDPEPGFYTIELIERFPLTVRTATSGAYLFWTDDGTTPTYDPATFRGTGTTHDINRPVAHLTLGENIFAYKFLAAKQGWFDSTVSQGTFHIDRLLGPACGTPYPDLLPGGYNYPLTLRVRSDFPIGGTLETKMTTGLVGGIKWRSKAEDLTQQSGTLQLWPDISGNGRDQVQANPLLAPIVVRDVVNGRAVVRFNGLQFMECASSLGLSQPNTIVAVFNQTSTTYAARVMDVVGGGRQLIGLETNGFFDSYAGSANVQDAWNHTGVWLIYMMIFNGANSVGYLNGVKVAAGNPGSNGLNIPRLGNDGGATGFIGDLAEIFVVDHALNTDERLLVWDYANTEYNIGSSWQNLDSGGGQGGGSELPDVELTATIKYTTNGQIPSRNGPGTTTRSGRDIILQAPCALKMVAYTRANEESDVFIGRYRVAGVLPSPTYDPPASRQTTFPLNVTVSCPPHPSLNIRWTVDGSYPTQTNGNLIASNSGTAVVPSPNTHLKAVAYAPSFGTSRVSDGLYTGYVPTPTHTPDGIQYTIGSTLNVSIDVPSPPLGVTLNGRYTTDGKIPTRTTGTLITSFPQVVGISGGYRELRTIAFDVNPFSGYSDSDVKQSNYDWIYPLPP